ncbi:lipoate--protein ligase family protein [Bacillus sp. FJAT-49870]|uniref:Lipoate--protein ligase family protein n=2 Tax=Lederbergia citri TaxID=2833580 RepID=A0A942YGX1_9BACI|nr:biotin/lipoate A/B protein ligase family protein [Lederbergia citri]MBS4195154.1 lipoate--protein ligase family protein [Lederbergia citri]
MALDECLLLWHSEGLIPPILRFYGWSKPTLSVGHFQKIDRTIDFSAIDCYGCEFVRRLTGGSAVLHDDELTYSVVVSEKRNYISESIRAAYFTLSKGILSGFHNLGIKADYSVPESHFKNEGTAVCFEKPSDYEMLVDGKKISGHAQTRKKGVLLQHGSLPFTMNTQLLFDLFQFSSEEKRQRQRVAFSNKAITMNEASENNITYELAVEAFTQGFKDALNLELQPFELTDAQWEEVITLANSKYKSEEWNFKNRKKVHE